MNAVPAILTATGHSRMRVSPEMAGFLTCAYLLGWRKGAK
jgi:hypothetical protein